MLKVNIIIYQYIAFKLSLVKMIKGEKRIPVMTTAIKLQKALLVYVTEFIFRVTSRH